MERLPLVPTDADAYQRALNRALFDWKRREDAERNYCYVPAGSGPPTKVPPMRDGFVPFYIDVVAHKQYFFDGEAWRVSAAFT